MKSLTKSLLLIACMTVCVSLSAQTKKTKFEEGAEKNTTTEKDTKKMSAANNDGGIEKSNTADEAPQRMKWRERGFVGKPGSEPPKAAPVMRGTRGSMNKAEKQATKEEN